MRAGSFVSTSCSRLAKQPFWSCTCRAVCFHYEQIERSFKGRPQLPQLAHCRQAVLHGIRLDLWCARVPCRLVLEGILQSQRHIIGFGQSLSGAHRSVNEKHERSKSSKVNPSNPKNPKLSMEDSINVYIMDRYGSYGTSSTAR